MSGGAWWDARGDGRNESGLSPHLVWEITGEAGLPRRSEEPTSELQSPCKLVCRLLLEKKRLPPSRSWTGLKSPASARLLAPPTIARPPLLTANTTGSDAGRPTATITSPCLMPPHRWTP